MKHKLIAILLVLAMLLTLGACSEAEETTISGMVVSVDGTVISLMEMDSANMGDMRFAEGEMPEMPEGMEGFGEFNPEDFGRELPNGENAPQWGNGDRPEMPEGMEIPEGMTMPDFASEYGGRGPGFGNFGENVETKELGLSNAHVSVEIDGGKASGSMEDIGTGTYVTVTVNGKGEATYVLVSTQSFFGGRSGK